MTPDAWRALHAEEQQLEDDLRRLAADPAIEDPTRVHLPARDAVRRLAALRDVLAAADPVDGDTEGGGRAVIGHRVTFLDDGELVTYALVIPGQGDPMHGWISADSPLGAALLEARPGEVVAFLAPAGPRRVEVVRIE
jgi:transcription elongation factor GreA